MLYRAALANQLRMVGSKKHPDVAISMGNIAPLLKDRGDLANPAELNTEVIDLLTTRPAARSERGHFNPLRRARRTPLRRSPTRKTARSSRSISSRLRNGGHGPCPTTESSRARGAAESVPGSRTRPRVSGRTVPMARITGVSTPYSKLFQPTPARGDVAFAFQPRPPSAIRHRATIGTHSRHGCALPPPRRAGLLDEHPTPPTWTE